jgi:hypothetical protein
LTIKLSPAQLSLSATKINHPQGDLNSNAQAITETPKFQHIHSYPEISLLAHNKIENQRIQYQTALSLSLFNHKSLQTGH